MYAERLAEIRRLRAETQQRVRATIATAIAVERARCAAVCRAVAAERWTVGFTEAGAQECAEAIERGPVQS